MLDLLLVGWLHLGVSGASLATCVGYSIPAVAGVVYFSRRRGTLYFVKPRCTWNVLWRSCSNGASEMLANLPSSITTAVFNILMMRMEGEDGVAAITLLVYTQYLFQAFFTGFPSGWRRYSAIIMAAEIGSVWHGCSASVFAVCWPDRRACF